MDCYCYGWIARRTFAGKGQQVKENSLPKTPALSALEAVFYFSPNS